MIVLKVDMLVKPGTEAKCREPIRILEEHSRKEPGCVMYIGHQLTDNPRKFVFYEQYKDEAALQAHRASPLQEVCDRRARCIYGAAHPRRSA